MISTYAEYKEKTEILNIKNPTQEMSENLSGVLTLTQDTYILMTRYIHLCRI